MDLCRTTVAGLDDPAVVVREASVAKHKTRRGSVVADLGGRLLVFCNGKSGVPTTEAISRKGGGNSQKAKRQRTKRDHCETIRSGYSVGWVIDCCQAGD